MTGSTVPIEALADLFKCRTFTNSLSVANATQDVLSLRVTNSGYKRAIFRLKMIAVNH